MSACIVASSVANYDAAYTRACLRDDAIDTACREWDDAVERIGKLPEAERNAAFGALVVEFFGWEEAASLISEKAWADEDRMLAWGETA
jgi:hypothetical protein